MPTSANIAQHLAVMAVRQPHTPALKIPRPRRDTTAPLVYLTLSFAELDAEVNAWGHRLQQAGVKPKDRVLVMVRQGLPLIASVFALFKHGAVPIVIDPGMGLRNFLRCVQRSRPDALLGIPIAQVLSHAFRGSFKSVKVRVGASGDGLHRISKPGAAVAPMPCLERARTDLAAILFTSGSTGPAKGVCYEHGMFGAQVEMIRETYSITPGEIDLPMLPIFALFNPALGMTTVVPEIDPSRPAAVDPARIVQAIRQENVTNSFGSPTLWNKISAHCIQNGMTLPSLKRVLCAGAPVPATLWENAPRFLTSGELHSPYGATEALPISSISATQWLAARGRRNEALGGTCVGRPVPGARVAILTLADEPISTFSSAQTVGPNQIGEIIVQGDFVTKTYDALPEATAAAKILGESADGAPTVWHRMGDCGYLDSDGALWFCGRKAERVCTAQGTLYTEPVDGVFRSLPGVARCALIGLGASPNQMPALVVQLESPTRNQTAQRAFAEKLRAHGRGFAATKELTHFFFHPNFPVDVRHNAKIHRLTLARWAATQNPIVIP